MVKRVGKYELGRTLGEGTFGKVKYAVNTETNEAVAIKVLDKEKIQKQNMGNQIKKEISIMKMVKHQYIISLIEVLASKTKIFIVLELVTGGELFDKIVSVGRLSEEQARFYFCQLLEGVDYCHGLGVCHRDLKPENLLLDEKGNLKISDFGLSSLYVGDADGDGATRTQVLHTTCGTPNYVAPEVLSDQGYDGKKADVWSIGVILYVLLAGFLPFDESTIVALFNKIKKAEFTYPSWISAEARSVIDMMLVADPKSRVALSQLRDHNWVKSGAAVSFADDPNFESSNKHVIDNSNMLDEDDDDEGGTARKPLKLNAFALTAKCGGFMLDRLFNPKKFCTIDSNALTAEPGGNLRFGTMKKSHTYHFTSPVTPPESLIHSVTQTLIAMGFEFEQTIDKIAESGRAKGSKVTAKGAVGIHIEVFEICNDLSLIEIQKGKGDLLQWNSLLTEIKEKCKDLILTNADEEKMAD